MTKAKRWAKGFWESGHLGHLLIDIAVGSIAFGVAILGNGPIGVETFVVGVDEGAVGGRSGFEQAAVFAIGEAGVFGEQGLGLKFGDHGQIQRAAGLSVIPLALGFFGLLEPFVLGPIDGFGRGDDRSFRLRFGQIAIDNRVEVPHDLGDEAQDEKPENNGPKLGGNRGRPN